MNNHKLESTVNNMNTSTLLVWEENPEDIKFYLIPNDVLTENDLDVLRGFNDKMINGDCTREETVIGNHISSALCADAEDCYPEIDPSWYCKWRCYEVADIASLQNVNVTRIFKCGFFL